MNSHIFTKSKIILAITIWLALVIGLTPSLVRPGQVSAASDAYFSLSPSSGSYTVGSTITMTVSETSAGADDTNGVQVNMSYPIGTLQYKSMSLSGPFTLSTQQTGGGGSIAIGCAAISTQSGTQSVATIVFNVIGSGSASVSMVSGPGSTPTNIVNTGGNSVWNNGLPSANFTLAAAAVTPPATPKTTAKTVTTTKTTTAPTTTTTTPAKTTTPTATTTTSTSKTPSVSQPLGSLSVTVTNSSGVKLKNAKVTLDNNKTVYTNQDGVANFAGVSGGSHSVTITDPGQKSVTNKLTLSAGQNELTSYELPASSVSTPSIILIIAAVFAGLGLLNVAYWKLIRKTPRVEPGGVTRPSSSVPATSVTPTAPTNLVSPSQPVNSPSLAVPSSPVISNPRPSANSPTKLQF